MKHKFFLYKKEEKSSVRSEGQTFRQLHAVMSNARNNNNLHKQAASQEQVLINDKILGQNIVHPNSIRIDMCSIIFRKIN
jgi:hypothetical protein